MKLAIASGKGGTGKTTLSVAISSYLAKKGHSVTIADVDVEEPNSNLFLQMDIEKKQPVEVIIPLVDKEKCTGCGKCEEICVFNAIVIIKGKPLVFPDLCHSCGGCSLACPEGAITDKSKETGILEYGKINDLNYVGGRIHVGEPLAIPAIKMIKKIDIHDDYVVYDCPPGTSCPVIESVLGTDFVVLITEASAFGLNDLTLAVEMIRELKLPFGVVINRFDIGDNRVEKYCKDENIDVLAKFPNSREVAEAYSNGDFVELFIDRFSNELDAIISKANSGGKI